QDLVEILEARGFRTVTIDTLVPGFRGRYVGTDNALAMKIGLEHLAGLGHERVTLIVNEPNDELTVTLKIDAFRKYAAEIGIRAEVVIPPMERWQNAFDV